MIITGTASSMNIGNDMIWDANSGTVSNNELAVDNTSSLTIARDLQLDYSGGMKILTIFSNTASLTVGRDIIYVATADNQTEIELNQSAILNIGRNFVRGTPRYGILTCNNISIVAYNGSVQQTFAQVSGSGSGDVFSYRNVTINNTNPTAPQLILDGDMTIPGILTLTDGEVLSTASNLLSFSAGSSAIGASIASFVDGPIMKIGNTPFEFPVGDANLWQPIAIANLSGDIATEFTAEYLNQSPANSDLVNAPLNNVSEIEYWDLSNTGTASNADVTLFWKDQSSSEIDDYDDLVIAHYNGADWDNLSQNSRVASDPGSITVTGVSSFSPFTFGSLSSAVNPLPVELVSFTGKFNGDIVILDHSF